MKTSNWQTKRLGDICEDLFAGGDVPKPNSSKFETDKFRVPIFSNGEKNKGLYGYTNIARVTKPSITISARGTIGYSEIREEAFYPAIRLIVAVPKTDIVDLFFLKYVVSRLDIIQSGSSIPQLTVPMIREYPIPLPPLPEQQRIVKILDEVFAAMAKAKENAEKNLANAAELFQSYLQSVFANPGKGWETCELGTYIHFIDYRGKTPTKTDKGLRLITAKNVKLGFLQRTPEEFISPKDYDGWMTRGIPKKSDVLFTTEAPLANVAQLDTDEKVVFAQRIIILQPQPNKIEQTFLKYMLLSKPIRQRLIEKGTGATVQGIKASLLRKIEIYFPSNMNEQHSIVTKLDALSAETRKLELIYKQKLAALEELKKSVLAKAFRGEL